MRTTITTCIDCELKAKAQPILKEQGLSIGVVLDGALKKIIEKEANKKRLIL